MTEEDKKWAEKCACKILRTSTTEDLYRFIYQTLISNIEEKEERKKLQKENDKLKLKIKRMKNNGQQTNNKRI